MKPCILGVSGYELSSAETEALWQLQPVGYILFARNIANPDQCAQLVAELKALSNHQPLILVDQEGGRVQRLCPPDWLALPCAAALGTQFHIDGGASIRAWAQEVAKQFVKIGANCCAAPVLDLYYEHASSVIGDRAYGKDPELVASVGTLVVEELCMRGIVPVVKHIPGHGRAAEDSHFSLSRVNASLDELNASDFVPFVALKDSPVAMTAHLVYEALDQNLPFTQSAVAIDWLRHRMGFGGLLLSDCIHMEALCGSIKERIDASLTAGVDVVIDSHSQPDQWLSHYAQHELAGDALQRLRKALAIITSHQPPVYDTELTKLLVSLHSKNNNMFVDPTEQR